jgi:hypothetical protein
MVVGCLAQARDPMSKNLGESWFNLHVLHHCHVIMITFFSFSSSACLDDGVGQASIKVTTSRIGKPTEARNTDCPASSDLGSLGPCALWRLAQRGRPLSRLHSAAVQRPNSQWQTRMSARRNVPNRKKRSTSNPNTKTRMWKAPLPCRDPLYALPA